MLTNTLLSTGAVLSAHTATYDPVGNRLGVLETINTEGSFGVTYSYDPANQLVSEVRYGLRPYSNTFTYDPAGNQLTVTPATGVITTNSYNAANAVILSKAGTAQPTTLTYDAAGNRLTENAAGSLTTFTWNYENRNTLLVSPSGVPLTNIYDAVGLRRNDGTSNYIWDRQNLLQIRNVVGGSKTFQFTSAPNVWDGVVSQYEPSGSDSQFYAFDMTSSNWVATHVTGGVTATFDYTAFGTEYYVTGGTNMMNRFGGKWGYFRPTSPYGLLYIQQRWLDMTLDQWLSRDASVFASGWNWHAYVRNNPLSRTDPTGLAPNVFCCNSVIKSCCPPPPKLPTPATCTNSPTTCNPDQCASDLLDECIKTYGPLKCNSEKVISCTEKNDCVGSDAGGGDPPACLKCCDQIVECFQDVPEEKGK